MDGVMPRIISGKVLGHDGLFAQWVSNTRMLRGSDTTDIDDWESIWTHFGPGVISNRNVICMEEKTNNFWLDITRRIKSRINCERTSNPFFTFVPSQSFSKTNYFFLERSEMLESRCLRGMWGYRGSSGQVSLSQPQVAADWRWRCHRSSVMLTGMMIQFQLMFYSIEQA